MGRAHGELAGTEPEVKVASAFLALTLLAQGLGDSEEELKESLQLLSQVEGGDMFVAQVETAQSVIGL